MAHSDNPPVLQKHCVRESFAQRSLRGKDGVAAWLRLGVYNIILQLVSSLGFIVIEGRVRNRDSGVDV